MAVKKDVNRTLITCRLTKDPELRSIPSGTSVCDLRVAVNRGTTRDGRDLGASFHTVQMWGVQAENAARYLSTGRRIFVEGRVEHDEWPGPDDRRRERNYIVAEQVTYLDYPAGERPANAEEPAHEDVPADTAAEQAIAA